MKKYVLGSWIFATMLFLNMPVLAGDAMIQDGSKVSMSYSLSVNGQHIESTDAANPFIYVHGQESIIPGLERQLAGLKEGDKRKIEVKSGEAYGTIDPNALVEVPKERFKSEDLQVGMVVTTKNKQGAPLRAIVKEVKENIIILDFNHPLAGKDLLFDVEIVSVS